jgi:hypothetical protein
MIEVFLKAKDKAFLVTSTSGNSGIALDYFEKNVI